MVSLEWRPVISNLRPALSLNQGHRCSGIEAWTSGDRPYGSRYGIHNSCRHRFYCRLRRHRRSDKAVLTAKLSGGRQLIYKPT